jgi:hypothetical protein
MEIGAPELWYFKMYGSGAGQSFHEQWAGSLDDPMTLRIRQSVEVYKARQVEEIGQAVELLRGEIDDGLLSTEGLTAISDVDVPALGETTTAAGIQARVRTIRGKLRTIAVAAMRAWALAAAGLMGKPANVVPASPESPAKLEAEAYGKTVNALLARWQAKGWAITRKAKKRLADRRASLVESRRKIDVAVGVAKG